jgi:hypothetical protein
VLYPPGPSADILTHLCAHLLETVWALPQFSGHLQGLIDVQTHTEYVAPAWRRQDHRVPFGDILMMYMLCC